MTTRNLKRVGRDALFAWVSLVVAILGASLLYAVLTVNQVDEPIQTGLPFALMVALLTSMYPPLELQKRVWLCLRNQLVDLFLTRDGWLVLFIFELTVIVTFALVMASKELVSVTQVAFSLSLLLLSLLVAAQWWDLLGNLWNKLADHEKWDCRLKKLFLVVPLAMISWLLWPFQSPTERIQGWSLFAATACLIFALPLVVSAAALIVALAVWNLTLQSKLSERISHIQALSKKMVGGKRWERAKNGFTLAHNLGLVFGIVLVLLITWPIVLVATAWLKSKSAT
jgi:hypothetical protein